MKVACENCKHWKYTCYAMGECEQIKGELTINLITGWSGGYVESIETNADFRCGLFEQIE